MESCCGHTPGRVPSLSPLPLPTVPRFPRHGGTYASPPIPLDKEQRAGGHSGRTLFLKNSGEQGGGGGGRRKEGEVGGRCPGSLHTQGGSWTKTSFPGKSGPCAYTCCPLPESPAPQRPPCPPHVAKPPPLPALEGLRGTSKVCGVRGMWQGGRGRAVGIVR